MDSTAFSLLKGRGRGKNPCDTDTGNERSVSGLGFSINHLCWRFAVFRPHRPDVTMVNTSCTYGWSPWRLSPQVQRVVGLDSAFLFVCFVKRSTAFFLFFFFFFFFFFFVEFTSMLHCALLLWCHNTYIAHMAIALRHTPRLPSKGPVDSGNTDLGFTVLRSTALYNLVEMQLFQKRLWRAAELIIIVFLY